MPLRTLAAAALLAAHALSAAELPPAVAERLAAAQIPEDAIAFIVKRVSDGKVVAAHGADRSMQPASTLKLLTSLAALETLGPAFRGRSELRTRGEVAGGVLEGDLVLRGEADVDLDWQAFQGMLRAIRLAGIREVRGDFLLDRTAFNPARTDVGVPPFDETPEFRYNVIPDALLLNSNLVHLDLASDAREVRVAMTPALAGVTVAARFDLVERDCEEWETGWVIPEVKTVRGSIRIVLRGTFPKQCAASTAINVLDREVFADRLFRAEWSRLGGVFLGRTRDGEAPSGTRILARHRSRPLGELVFDIDKDSDNPIARVIYLAMGASAGDPGLSTARAAERHVRAWLARKAIMGNGLVLENGSGLSRSERIRPSELAAVLEAALASPWAPEFLASLPIVAVDGSMSRRLRGTPAAARSRIKTGTLRDVSAVAGYVKDSAGETYIVVAMVNHERAVKQVARPILDALLEWVVEPSGPGEGIGVR